MCDYNKIQGLAPGSKEAQEAGCLCPVMDNHYGRGVGDGMFWRNANCPLHGITFKNKSNNND